VLHQFLTANRNELIRRCSAKVALRRLPGARDGQLVHGVPLFIDQLAKTLRLEKSPQPDHADPARRGEIGEAATRHGRELLQHDFPVDQVVRDYGDLCQAITELALEFGKPIKITEFRTLNRCLDDAIADAVTEYSSGKQAIVAAQATLAVNAQLGLLAQELHNTTHAASMALLAIRSGDAGVNGATGQILEDSLLRLRHLIDHSLADVRVTAGMSAPKQRLSVAKLIAEIAASANHEAEARDCTLSISYVDPALIIDVDQHLLTSALGNVLQHAFRFTRPGTEISIDAHACADRILIEVTDCCGGLATRAGEDIFASGPGAGLSSSRRSVEANDGFLSVRDIPGFGCVFTIDLPRR